MTPRIASFALISGLLLSSAGAQAEGLYVGAGTLLRHYDLTQPNTTAKDSATGHALSGKLTLGYDINEHWAVEGGYTGLGKPGYDYTLNGSAGHASIEGHAWWAAAKAKWALNDSVISFVKIGLDRHQEQPRFSGAAAGIASRQTTTALYLGAGLQFKLDKHWSATVELEHLGQQDKPRNRLNGLATSLQYNF